MQQTIVNKFKHLKVAIVHDLLVRVGGAETVLLELLKIFPHADIFTVLYDKEPFVKAGKRWAIIYNKNVKTSKYNFLVSKWWQKLPSILSSDRNYFFLWPKAVEAFDFSKYDLVISSHFIAAHGVITQEHTLHISYTHTPARYFYSHYHEYMNSPFMNKGLGKLKRLIYPPMAYKFRLWDEVASMRPDYYVANSTAVKMRIKKYYNRDATVIYPPAELSRFVPTKPVKKKNFYYTLARLVPQKKIDAIVKAFVKMGKELYVTGKGPEIETLKKIAKGHKNIHLLGFTPDEEVERLYQEAKGFVFASYEDFGIVPLEAMAAGTPVISFNKGGPLDYIIPGKTGIFFEEQTPEAIIEAINKFEKIKNWDRNYLINFATQFSTEKFRQEFANFVSQKLEEYNNIKKPKHHEQ